MSLRHVIIIGLLLFGSATGALAQAASPAHLAGPAAPAAPAALAGTGFTYSGELNTGGTPVTGTCGFNFSLHDAENGGVQIGGTDTVSGVSVANGRFTVIVNSGGEFGSRAFDGSARWLAIAVRCPDTGGYTALSPRQPLTPAPMALGLPGLRTEQNITSTNVIGGFISNTVASGVYGAAIGGGGSDGLPNSVTAAYGTVAGGADNHVSGAGATVSGGSSNVAADGGAVVAGGSVNQATGSSATISGGYLGVASGDAATIGGGAQNLASQFGATVGGGSSNSASSFWATVGGGASNIATVDYAVVAGGYNNKASGQASTVSGGEFNIASALGSTIGGGGVSPLGQSGNKASAAASTVGGGFGNTSSGTYTVIGGGLTNTASNSYATIAGGRLNTASGTAAAVGGGVANTANNANTTVGGGQANIASGIGAVVGGGVTNTASGNYATVPGGVGNVAQGDGSFAAGAGARALHFGSFVFADVGTNTPLSTTAGNQFLIRAVGGVDFWSNIALTSGCHLAAGGISWSCSSDRNIKANFAPVNGVAVLDTLMGIPIETWNATTQDAGIRHMGPMAQDFYAAFNLGEGDKTIDGVDADGVALAAIQGLNTVVQEKEAEIAALNERVAALEAHSAGSPAAPANDTVQLALVLVVGLLAGAGIGAGAFALGRRK